MTQTPQRSASSSKGWAARPIASLAVIASLCVLVWPQAALAKEKQVMTYDVYAGGFHVVKAGLNVDTTQDGRYRLALDSGTRGFLDRLVRWKGLFETTGWRSGAGGKARPETHRSAAQSGDDYEEKTYRYNRDGGFVSYSVKDKHDDGKKPRPVDAALTAGTTDALTATLLVMQKIAAGGKCEGSEEIFDGSRRYRLTFRHQREVMMESNKYNVFSGPAVECTAEVTPLAGKWHEKPRGWMSIQEQGRKAGTMPTVWFAKMTEGEPAVPVRIRVKTDYGTLFMHLTSYSAGGEKIVAKGR